MNKRGDQELQWAVGLIVIILFVYGALSYKVNNITSGSGIKDQAVVKQVALLIDSAGPGSEFIIYKNISVEGKKVRSGLEEYEFFTGLKVSTTSVEGGVSVRVG